MTQAVAELLDILDLERIETDLFRGNSPQMGWQRVFGGLVISQALVAAIRTVEESRAPHSLHAYFILPGDPAVPIVYQVERLRDGGSFTTRRVTAIQHGKAIFALMASFQAGEAGHDHQVAMPQVPDPETLPTEAEFKQRFLPRAPDAVRRYWDRERPIEMRPTDLARFLSKDRLEPRQAIWFRTTGPLPDDAAIHRCVLAYTSDMTLLDTSLVPHGKSVFDLDIQAASLDHALWFHRPFRADDWLLYAQESPTATASRGFTRGLIFSRDGRLVASVAQEGLIRPRPDRIKRA